MPGNQAAHPRCKLMLLDNQVEKGTLNKYSNLSVYLIIQSQ